jgi:superfamily I DNA/RNA helicase
MLERAAKAHAVREFDGAFLWAEWDGVVDYWGIGSEEAYRHASREGRGTALSPQARSKLWPVFADVRAEMARQRVHTWSSLAYALASHLDSRGERPFTHVVADEAQDFGPCQLRLIRALASEARNDLTFAGDLGQQIYRRPFSWISMGIDIRGRSSRLRISYRTTDQIRTLADGVAAAAGDKNAEEARDALSVRAGPAPRLVEASSGAEEAAVIGRWMAACIRDGVRPEQIAIFARTTKTLERVAAKAAKIAGVPFVELKDADGPTAGAVSLGTMHRAKGLEYRAVAVIGCSAGMVPLAKALEEAPDEAERDLVMKQERHLLYVALTRARDYLLVTWSGQRSPFLEAAGEASLAA